MIDEVESPIFVCSRCGKITKVLFYEGEVVHCPYCKNNMTYTEFSILKEEHSYFFGDCEEAKQFRSDIFVEFVKHSENFDSALHRKRLDEEAAVIKAKAEQQMNKNKLSG